MTELASRADNLQDHLGRYLGPIAASWQRPSRVGEPSVQLLRFDNKPSKGLTTMTTLGLSKFALRSRSGTQFRQELVLSCGDCANGAKVKPLLDLVADELITEGRALSRGDLLGPHGPLIPGAEVTALYATIPVFYPSAFAQWNGSTPPTIFVQLIPITTDEAELRRKREPEEFEKYLEMADPDVFDFARRSTLLSNG